jgi:hypothetical protein
VIDPFVVYRGDFDYPSLRSALCDALYAKDVARLEEATKVVILLHEVFSFRGVFMQDMNIREGAILLFGMYETITLSYSSNAMVMDDDVIIMMPIFLFAMFSL